MTEKIPVNLSVIMADDNRTLVAFEKADLLELLGELEEDQDNYKLIKFIETMLRQIEMHEVSIQ